ncbi:MAG: hypothetical protein LBQ19_01345 [Synergistaceae bacterium]|jgi:hypothetical protein|nr:hypothetical protein [Synergistaceae bacterium]
MEEIKNEILRAIGQKRATKCQGTNNLRIITLDMEGKELSDGDGEKLANWLESLGYTANWTTSPKPSLSIGYSE